MKKENHGINWSSTASPAVTDYLCANVFPKNQTVRFDQNLPASHFKKTFLRTIKMHKITDIFKNNFTTNAKSADLLTVSSPMCANTASHEEQHYLWASVSEGKLWWFSSMISLPKEFLCTCYPEQASKHALSHYQLPFFHFSTSYVTVHS